MADLLWKIWEVDILKLYQTIGNLDIWSVWFIKDLQAQWSQMKLVKTLSQDQLF